MGVFSKKDKRINVKVLTLANEFEFKVGEKTLGRELFDQILQTIGIREKWYFGLQYSDSKDNRSWLELDQKVSKLLNKNKKDETLIFSFRVKFFPENVEDEIIQQNTLQMFYLQIRKDILNQGIHCPAEKAVLLASFAAQVKHGNYDHISQKDSYLANDKILAESVVNGHKLTREEWEGKISMFHAKLQAMTKEEAMLEYMKVSQDLEQYGVAFFEVMNRNKNIVFLGVDALGINIYEKSNKLNPNISFPWSEINKVTRSSDNKLNIKMTDKKAPKMVVTCTQPGANNQIYFLINGNHEMYMRRRRPDTLDVQQMKSERKDDDERKAKEKELLSREMAAREKAEQLRVKMEQKYKEMEERMVKKEEEVKEKDRKIKELEEQLNALREAKDNLEKQQNELREMMEKLEEDKTLQATEREKMEEEVRKKQEEIENVRKEVEEKERLARELQEEVEESRRKMEETMTMMNNNDAAQSDTSSEHDNSDDIPTIVVDPVDDGREVSMDDKMAEDVEDLSQELEMMKDEENESEENRLYRENVRLTGRDKYKTLRQVRQGNTKRRIDSFENL